MTPIFGHIARRIKLNYGFVIVYIPFVLFFLQKRIDNFSPVCFFLLHFSLSCDLNSDWFYIFLFPIGYLFHDISELFNTEILTLEFLDDGVYSDFFIQGILFYWVFALSLDMTVSWHLSKGVNISDKLFKFG
jgi:hypothetical protein